MQEARREAGLPFLMARGRYFYVHVSPNHRLWSVGLTAQTVRLKDSAWFEIGGARVVSVQEDGELLPHSFAARGDRLLEQIVLHVWRQMAPDVHDRFAQCVGQLVFSPA